MTIPIDIDLTDAEAGAVEAAVDVAKRAHESGLLGALGRLARAGAHAVRERRGKRPPK